MAMPNYNDWTPGAMHRFAFVQMPKVGFYQACIPRMQNTLDTLLKNSFHFLVTPSLVVKRPGKTYVTICDLALSSEDWAKFVVAYLTTSEFHEKKANNFTLFEKTLATAKHLSLANIIVEMPEDPNAIARLARLLNAKIFSTNTSIKVNIHVRLISSKVQSKEHMKEVGPNTAQNPDNWKNFQLLKSHIGYDNRLGICFEVDGDLPDMDTCKRWHGETITMIMLNPNLLKPDGKKICSLPGAYANFINSMVQAMGGRVSIILKGPIPSGLESAVAKHFHELGNNHVSSNLVDTFASGFEDFLQIPLQPLADNLESTTYEIFEKDPIKYEKYKQALTIAIQRFPKDKPVVILLVGAGRGPLIRCALRATAETDRIICLYAIEKNSNAANTLLSQNWLSEFPTLSKESSVKIVNLDIRDWEAPEKADILVSELLGSFGDNELSPECLDAAWKSVKETAISIPESYRSHVGPIMSNRLYTNTLALPDSDKEKFLTKTEFHYVSHIKSYFEIAKPKVLFEFIHKDLTIPPKERDNSRYNELRFVAPMDCIIHGFAGYFDAVLIDDITISIVPETHTENLISWFSVWIPLSRPVPVAGGEQISLHFWRIVTKSKVWYEWCLSAPEATPIQNINGRAYSIGLF